MKPGEKEKIAIIEEIKCPKCGTLIKNIKNKKAAKGRILKKVLAIGSAGGIGAWIGSSAGIAMFGSAISGTFPFALVAAGVMALATSKSSSTIKCPKCGTKLKFK